MTRTEKKNCRTALEEMQSRLTPTTPCSAPTAIKLKEKGRTGEINWVQVVMFGGDIYNTDINDKYNINYVSLNVLYDADEDPRRD